MTTYEMLFACGHVLPIAGMATAATKGVAGSFRYCPECRGMKVVQRVDARRLISVRSPKRALVPRGAL